MIYIIAEWKHTTLGICKGNISFASKQNRNIHHLEMTYLCRKTYRIWAVDRHYIKGREVTWPENPQMINRRPQSRRPLSLKTPAILNSHHLPYLWIWKGVPATLKSGRYTILYPIGRITLHRVILGFWNKKSHCSCVTDVIPFEIIIYILVGYFRFIQMPMLWVYYRLLYIFSYFSVVIDFRRQNLISNWRIKSVPTLKRLKLIHSSLSFFFYLAPQYYCRMIAFCYNTL